MLCNVVGVPLFPNITSIPLSVCPAFSPNTMFPLQSLSIADYLAILPLLSSCLTSKPFSSEVDMLVALQPAARAGFIAIKADVSSPHDCQVQSKPSNRRSLVQSQTSNTSSRGRRESQSSYDVWAAILANKQNGVLRQLVIA